MNIYRCLALSWLVLSLSAWAEGPAESAARGVLQRTIGDAAAKFDLSLIPAADGKDVFEVSAADGRVTVRGNNGVALCRGAYTYLREIGGAMITWGGAQVGLPEALPDLPLRRVVAPLPLRLQDNICTFGYTTAFYGWKEWERYLDVMALHGFNLTMAPLGGEAIWSRVWKQFGLTDAELAEFFTGPAFLPWHRMGNVNKHDGPLPASYFPQSVVLEKRILARMRELGIQPIAPAFSGFVPAGFKRAQPAAQVLDMKAWCGFGGPYGSHMLHPLSPLYPEIGKAYITAWQKEFGNADFYQADSFNEMDVPVSGDHSNQLAQLAAFGGSVYSAIKAGDPDGTWVMMAWAFLSGFWTPERAQALLSQVPENRMLILDLFCESQPQWRKYDAFFGKPWVFSVLPNFGGNSQFLGSLAYLAKTVPDVPSLPGRRNLSGFGYSGEGNENNEVIYELASDAAWSAQPLDLAAWLRGYARARYGLAPAPVREAWTLLSESVYAGGNGSVNQAFQRRPAGGSYGANWACDERLGRAADLLLYCAPEFKGRTLYANDVIEATAMYLGTQVDRRLQAAVTLRDAGMAADATRCLGDALEMLSAMDRLLASHTLFRLDRWVAQAREWGATPAERDYYEQDAKRQVTVWGAGGAQLSEYAAKLWSGLTGGYYGGRWRAWFQATDAGQAFDTRAWEEQWIKTPGNAAGRPFPDPMAQAEALLARARSWDTAALLRQAQGTPVGTWRSGEMTEAFADRDWEIASSVKVPGALIFQFKYTGGSHRLDIARAALLVDGAEVAADEHEGTTGVANQGNIYRLAVPAAVKPGAKVVLRAKIKSAGGTDSNGEVLMRTAPSP